MKKYFLRCKECSRIETSSLLETKCSCSKQNNNDKELEMYCFGYYEDMQEVQRDEGSQ